MIHVCSLARLHDVVAGCRAEHVVTLINEATAVRRPESVRAENHLYLGMNDITEPMEGMVPPGEDHIAALLDFVQRWPREAPLVIHCWAGISRSTAAGYITLCALYPEIDEMKAAVALRERAPTATPNARLVRLADDMLGRGGRMADAIGAIGRGEFCAEGTPFILSPDQIGQRA